MTVGHVLLEIGRSLRESFLMLWATLWALALGFGLSGAIQAFAPTSRLRDLLGNRRPAAVARATGFGMASSSCSYAAASMARSLFRGGADLLTALVFMVASTNLVIELGIVMLVLLGWQFLAAEFTGGPIMIVLLASFGGLLLTPRVVAMARARVGPPEVGTAPATCEAHAHHAAPEPPPAAEHPRADWTSAVAFALSDVRMLWRELLIGFTVAGFLAVAVPTRVWSTLFVHGHGLWTSAENAAIGPLIAMLSWVCSIGNVPMAAALWHGGISFGGVIAFIFGDLIAMPLVLVYRRLYGTRVALRLVVLLYVVMAVAGLLTELAFRGLGIIPAHHLLVGRTSSLGWQATTALDLVLVPLAALAWWRARARRDAGSLPAPACEHHGAVHQASMEPSPPS